MWPDANPMDPDVDVTAQATGTDPRRIVAYVVVAALILLLAIQYLRALRPAAANALESDCRSLKPAPFNPALGRIPAPAPAFSATDYTGARVDLAAYRGKTVLLNFWNTECDPCVRELPGMERLQARLGGDAVVLALASEKTFAPVEQFFAGRGTNMSLLLDPPAATPADGKPSAVGEIALRYGTQKWPETYLIDKDGNVRYYFINERDWGSDKAFRCVRSVIDGT